jgi:hypothetical protein
VTKKEMEFCTLGEVIGPTSKSDFSYELSREKIYQNLANTIIIPSTINKVIIW